jgi:ABC-type branched-subunit amino acid transport system ATPase component
VSQPLLEVESLEFSYGNVQVLFGIDLVVAEGEMVALLGTNGAGKSTLLRAIAGLRRPSGGRIRLRGLDVTGADVVEMVRSGVIMMPGGAAVFPDMTVAENLEIATFSLANDPGRATQRITAALDLFPQLRARVRVQAGALSGGEQQQLALAKAFIPEPDVLCIDELSLGLAPGVVEVLLEVVRQMHQAGTTVVLVEQSLNVAAALCERAVFLEKGAVRFEGPTQDLLDNSDVARAVFLARAAGAGR